MQKNNTPTQRTGRKLWLYLDQHACFRPTWRRRAHAAPVHSTKLTEAEAEMSASSLSWSLCGLRSGSFFTKDFVNLDSGPCRSGFLEQHWIRACATNVGTLWINALLNQSGVKSTVNSGMFNPAELTSGLNASQVHHSVTSVNVKLCSKIRVCGQREVLLKRTGVLVRPQFYHWHFTLSTINVPTSNTSFYVTNPEGDVLNIPPQPEWGRFRVGRSFGGATNPANFDFMAEPPRVWETCVLVCLCVCGGGGERERVFMCACVRRCVSWNVGQANAHSQTHSSSVERAASSGQQTSSAERWSGRRDNTPFPIEFLNLSFVPCGN